MKPRLRPFPTSEPAASKESLDNLRVVAALARRISRNSRRLEKAMISLVEIKENAQNDESNNLNDRSDAVKDAESRDAHKHKKEKKSTKSKSAPKAIIESAKLPLVAISEPKAKKENVNHGKENEQAKVVLQPSYGRLPPRRRPTRIVS